MRLVALAALCSSFLFAQDARDIVLRSVKLDSDNYRIARNYTFVERSDNRENDAQGRLKQHRVLTCDVTLLEGSPYRRLIARDDKPLPPAQEKKERPEQVHELRRHHHGSQGGARCNLFRRQGDAEVANKHKGSHG